MLCGDTRELYVGRCQSLIQLAMHVSSSLSCSSFSLYTIVTFNVITTNIGLAYVVNIN